MFRRREFAAASGGRPSRTRSLLLTALVVLLMGFGTFAYFRKNTTIYAESGNVHSPAQVIYEFVKESGGTKPSLLRYQQRGKLASL